MLKRALLLAIGLIIQTELATADGIIDTGPPAQQQYQQGGTPPAQAVPQRTPVAPVPETNGTPPPMSSEPSPTAPSEPGVAPNTPEQALGQQLIRLEGRMLQQNQQVQEQVSKIGEQSAATLQEVTQMQTRLKALEEKVPGQGAASSPWLQKLQDADRSLSSEMKLIIMALVFLIALFLGSLMGRGSRSKETVVKPVRRVPPAAAVKRDVDDTDSEYDFMSTAEAIPAKLDLARAYVAMEDYKSARSALQEVLREGNDQQKKEAQEILSSLPAE